MSFTPEQPHDGHLIDLATECVELAKQGNFQSGMEVIIQSRIAIRGLIEHGESPDPFRVIFVKALLDSLDSIVAGGDPLDCLSLRKPRNRLPDPAIPVRNVLLWTKVGGELDRLTERGHTRQDKPIEAAIKSVSKEMKLDIEVVGKAWRDLGGAEGWERDKADWK